MSAMHDLQLWLRDTGRYHGALDGDYGRLTKEATLAALFDGPDTQLSDADYLASSRRTAIPQSAIRAFAEVEAAGVGFDAGKPKLLFEPHVFSRLSKGKFDTSHPHLSYPKWGARPYPKDLDTRYGQLLEAVGLDPWAAFQSASYGKFQVMGFHFAACGFATPWAFAGSQAYDEATQLKAFESVIREMGIVPALRASMWAQVARTYNGPAYAKNRYDVKLAQAARAWQQKLDRAA